MSRFDNFVQFVKFGMVGVTNTIISYAVYFVVLLSLKDIEVSWDYIVGNIISFVLSVLWSFYWNNRFVFKAKDGTSRNIWITLMKTYVAYGFTGIILSNVLSFLWIDKLCVSKYIAPILNLVISVPFNFIVNKKWTFKERNI